MPTNEEIFLAGDVELLYTKNTGIMHHIVKGFMNTGVEYDELFGLCELAFMKAYKTFNVTVKWATYFTRVAQNEILMYLRKQKKWNNNVSFNEIIGTDNNGKSLALECTLRADIDIEGDFIATDEIELLRACINELEPKDRQIIELSLQGLKQGAIAESMGVTQTAVSRRLKRIYFKLRKKYEKGDAVMSKNKGKSKTKQVFNPPTRYPQTLPGEMRRIKENLDRQRTEDNNNVMNLTVSAFAIVLHEFFEFSEEKLKETIEKVYEQLDLCGKELVTIDQMMDLCGSYGLEITQTSDHMDAIGKMLQDKIKVYELLEQGVTEVEDLAKRTNISSRHCSSYRWQWNKEKYGKDYREDIEMATKRAMACKLFDLGKSIDEVVKAIDATKGSVANFKVDWKKDRMSGLTSEEMSSVLTGEKELWQVIQEKVGASKVEAVEEIKKDTVPVQVTEEVRKPIELKVTEESSKQKQKRGLRKTVVVYGEFAEYRPSDGPTRLIDVEVSGQILSMTREELLTLVEEFTQVAEDRSLWEAM